MKHRLMRSRLPERRAIYVRDSRLPDQKPKYQGRRRRVMYPANFSSMFDRTTSMTMLEFNSIYFFRARLQVGSNRCL